MGGVCTAGGASWLLSEAQRFASLSSPARGIPAARRPCGRRSRAICAQVNPAQAPGKVVALVSPHAGYAYSGPTAAHAFAQVRGADYARVVLIGPLHRPIRGSRLGAWMTPAEDAYRTPLGDVRLDRSFIAELGSACL